MRATWTRTPVDTLTADEVARARELVRVAGVEATARRLGLSAPTLRKVLSGCEPVHRATAVVVRAWLAQAASVEANGEATSGDASRV